MTEDAQQQPEAASPPPPMIRPEDMPPPPPPPPDPCRYCGHERSEHDADGVCTVGGCDGLECPGFAPEPPRNEHGEELHIETTATGARIVTIVRPPAPPAPPPTTISRLLFLERFTDSEAVAIDMASRGDTTAAAQLRRYMQLVQMADEVRLDSPRTIGGVHALEQAGLIGPGRADQILDPSFRADGEGGEEGGL